jgi:hypothetical protein
MRKIPAPVAHTALGTGVGFVGWLVAGERGAFGFGFFAISFFDKR